MTLLVVLVAFTFSCGGQWYVLQALAWANMIRDYSQTVSLTQAVEMTLSGKYPCSVCQAIADRKQSDNMKVATQQKQVKKRVSGELMVSFAPGSISPQVYFISPAFLQTRSDAPPTPPPRFL